MSISILVRIAIHDGPQVDQSHGEKRLSHIIIILIAYQRRLLPRLIYHTAQLFLTGSVLTHNIRTPRNLQQ